MRNLFLGVALALALSPPPAHAEESTSPPKPGLTLRSGGWTIRVEAMVVVLPAPAALALCGRLENRNTFDPARAELLAAIRRGGIRLAESPVGLMIDEELFSPGRVFGSQRFEYTNRHRFAPKYTLTLSGAFSPLPVLRLGEERVDLMAKIAPLVADNG